MSEFTMRRCLNLQGAEDSSEELLSFDGELEGQLSDLQHFFPEMQSRQTSIPTRGQTGEIRTCERSRRAIEDVPIPMNPFVRATEAFGLTAPEPGSLERRAPRAPELASQRRLWPERAGVSPPDFPSTQLIKVLSYLQWCLWACTTTRTAMITIKMRRIRIQTPSLFPRP